MRNFYARSRGALLCCSVFLSTFCFGQTAGIATERTSPKGIISFPTSASSTGLAAGSYVDGYVKKNGGTFFVFPVGDNGEYKPFGASGDGTVGAYFQENPGSAGMPSGAPFSSTAKETTLSKVSAIEFWDVDGSIDTKLTFTWSTVSDVANLTNNTLKNLTIAGWNTSTSRWEKVASLVDVTSILGSVSSLSAGSITTLSAITPTAYQVYTLAAVTASAPLPVTLVSFEAVAGDSKNAFLKWTTSSELNSFQFDIQHSNDGQIWETRGVVSAKGESKSLSTYMFEDKITLQGQNLYRLKMIDRDQTFAFSRIANVLINASHKLVLYPNPVSDRLFVDGGDLAELQQLAIWTTGGAKLYTTSTVSTSGVDVKNLPAGGYLVSLAFKNGTQSKHKIIITR